jgi:hypothetical protein
MSYVEIIDGNENSVEIEMKITFSTGERSVKRIYSGDDWDGMSNYDRQTALEATATSLAREIKGKGKYDY